MTVQLGIIGVGEAGAAIAGGLHSAHQVTVLGFDARAGDVAVQERADRAGVELVADLPALARAADVIVCLTSATAAVPVATAVAAHLTSDHVYTDWNSTSPAVKRRVADVVTATGVAFADGAVMAAVPQHRHRVPVLASGNGAQRLHDALTPWEMRVEVLGPEPGQASAVKMFRSLLVKGLESLLLECAVGAHAYGVTRRVLESMNGSLPTEDWTRLAAYLLQRTALHGERRAEELRQVAQTLYDVGLEPLLADAGARRLQWFVDLGVTTGATAEGLDYDGLLRAVDEARGLT